MARFLKTKKEEVGIAPDTLLFRGIKKRNDVLLRVIDYNAENQKELVLDSINEALSFSETKTTTWFNVDGLHDEKIMREISTGFNLAPHILSDVMNTHARPKIQEYDNCLYISLKMLEYDEVKNRILSENIVLIIKENILITFQERKGDVFEPLRERIRKNKKRLRTSGTDYLAFAILDIIFDNYKYVISFLGEKIEVLEEKLLSNPNMSILEEINTYKKEIIYINKSIKPCREIVMELVKLDSDYFSSDLELQVLELEGNIKHSTESGESYREMLSDLLNIYHMTISSKLNDIMKFLTVFSVIFIPLTFIAGVYGTNFDNVPELHYHYSYYIMWVVMLITALIMILYFRRKKWF